MLQQSFIENGSKLVQKPWTKEFRCPWTETIRNFADKWSRNISKHLLCTSEEEQLLLTTWDWPLIQWTHVSVPLILQEMMAELSPQQHGAITKHQLKTIEKWNLSKLVDQKSHQSIHSDKSQVKTLILAPAHPPSPSGQLPLWFWHGSLGSAPIHICRWQGLCPSGQFFPSQWQHKHFCILSSFTLLAPVRQIIQQQFSFFLQTWLT